MTPNRFHNQSPLVRVNAHRRCPGDKPVRGGLGVWWHYTFTDPPRPKLTPPKPSPKPVERRRTDGEIRRVAE